ncbi:MAG: HD domain-containing phosphohydrolase [Gammaproteobacteria bacterium]
MKPKAQILAADDQADNRLILNEILSPHYRVRLLANGSELLEQLRKDPSADLILLDVVMPGIDGFEVCKRLKQMPEIMNIPVIFLTSLDNCADEEYGLSIGAEDFIHKPFSEPVILARIRNQLRISDMARQLRIRNEVLEAKISERTQALIAAQSATITAFCSLAETRDNETGNHIARTQHYVKALAEALRQHAIYDAELTDEDILLMFKSAPLHDIGKVGIPDAILNKRGGLSPDEWSIMKRHCQIGADVIGQAETQMGTNGFLRYAREIALCHHEKWDGTGYPNALRGDRIPLSARLMAVADVYDALISRRCYKIPFSHKQTVDMILAEEGKHFDPLIVDVFAKMTQRFAEIAERFKDTSNSQLGSVV